VQFISEQFLRQGRIDRSVLVAVRKIKPDAALRLKDRADAKNVFVRSYSPDISLDLSEGAQKGVDTSNLTGVPVNLLGCKLESSYR